MEERFDAIVVGAGLAGCAAAYSLAKDGHSVLVLERGRQPGAKNVSGGVIYGDVMHRLIPNFWDEAPVERHVSRRVITFLSEESSLSLDFKSANFDKPPYIGFTVLRARFDRWFASKAEQAGAIVASGLHVENVLREGDQVVGVEAGGSPFMASVVIAADGANSIIAQKAGLRGEISPRQVNVGVKEIIKLSPEIISERFGVDGDDGVVNEFVGACTKGLHGGAFLYTNKDSLSLGVIVNLEAVAEAKIRTLDLIEEFKQHPAIKHLVKGGDVQEYSAHLIPIAGLEMMPKLYTGGMLVAGDAAGFLVATGLILEGMNYAVASGVAAAEAIEAAKERNDFSATSLAEYERRLEDHSVLPDLRTFKNAPHMLDNQRMYTTYPEFATSLAEKVFGSESGPKKKLWQVAREEMKGKVSLLQLLRDGWEARKTL